jgi:hypothetical protein
MMIRILVLSSALVLGLGAEAQNQTDVKGGAAVGTQTSASTTQNAASATASGSASAATGANQANAAVAGGTEVNATLVKPLDARSNKPGDEVTAKATHDIKSGGQVIIPKGSKLVGHVTRAQARTKSSAGENAQSQLGIVFERAVLKDGREIPLNATVQAVAASAATVEADRTPAVMSGSGSGSAGGGLVGGVSGTVSGATSAVAGASGATSSTMRGTANVVSKSAGATGGLDTAGRLTAGSKGVFGLKGFDITSPANVSGEGSLITSTTHNVRLDGGTRMLLVTGGGNGAVGSMGAAANAAGSASGTVNKSGDSNPKTGGDAPVPPDRSDRR